LKLFYHIDRAGVIISFLSPAKKLRAFSLRPVIRKYEFRAFKLLTVDAFIKFYHLDDITHCVFLLNIELVLLDELVFEQVYDDLFLKG
jgi:hypothetical protein